MSRHILQLLFVFVPLVTLLAQQALPVRALALQERQSQDPTLPSNLTEDVLQVASAISPSCANIDYCVNLVTSVVSFANTSPLSQLLVLIHFRVFLLGPKVRGAGRWYVISLLHFKKGLNSLGVVSDLRCWCKNHDALHVSPNFNFPILAADHTA